MDKFLPYKNTLTGDSGGHSLKLNEFELMQSAYFDGFNALIKKLIPTGNGILDGFQIIVGVNVVNTAGYVAINGEIFKIDDTTGAGFAAAANNPTNNLYVAISEIDIEPKRDYEDGQQHYVEFQRRAILKYKEVSDTTGVLYKDLSFPSSVLEGSIIPWLPPKGRTVSEYFDNTGLGINAARGYAMCNGLNGTDYLDLKGMYLAMATNAFSNTSLRGILNGVTSNEGDESGNNVISLNGDQNGAHVHALIDGGHIHDITYSQYSQRGSENSSFGSTTGIKPNQIPASGTTTIKTGITESKQANITINPAGGGLPHENRPPTKYVYYITKLK